MKRHGLLAAALICFAVSFATVAAAATKSPVDGQWKGSMNTPNGEFTITFHFKANGKTLTGSVETQMGSQPIQDGKLDGDKISFDTTFGNGTTIHHEGTVSGNTMHLKVTGPFGSNNMTLKKEAASSKSAN